MGSKQTSIEQALSTWHHRQKDRLSTARIDSVDLEAGKSFAGPLVKFLRQRVYG